jgi:lipopolysaccharide export system permease protein
MLFESLLAQPIFLFAMVLFAACFSLRMARRGGAFFAALSGIAVGSFAFGFNDVVFTLGINQSLPTLLAAFAVPVIAMSAGATALLHLEDG